MRGFPLAGTEQREIFFCVDDLSAVLGTFSVATEWVRNVMWKYPADFSEEEYGVFLKPSFLSV